MSKDKDRDMQISEAELGALTADMVDAQNESMPKMNDSAQEWVEVHGAGAREQSKLTKSFDRRRFLVMSGITAAGGVVLAACSTSPASSTTGTTGTGTTGKSTGTGTGTGSTGKSSAPPVDVQVAGLAASLENLAVATYAAGITAALAGKLGKVPAAVATFAETAMAQHKQHAAAWNAILTGAGYNAVTGPDTVVQKLVDADFAKVTDLTGLAKLALTLETVAAATYLNGLTVVSSKQAIGTAASIQPVEMQHVAILNFVLGTYPVPDAFSSTTGARPPSDYTKLTKAS